jgi:hypothetical protein
MKFKKPIEVQAGISDGDPTNPLGQAGYLLSSDGSNVNWVSPGGLSAETAEAIVQPIKADEALAKGDPLYIVGYQTGQDVNIVAKADSSLPAKMPVVGLADADYASQAFGTMTAFGSFNGSFDTTGPGTESWALGDIIFVKPGGGLTNIRPGGTDLIQNVAIVSRVQQNTGELEVIALGRTNDVPNLPEGRLFVGTATNTSLASDVVYVDDANGRVGIGTDDPDARLNVVGGGGILVNNGGVETVLSASPNTGIFSIGDTGELGDGVYATNTQTSYFDIYSGGGVKFRMDANGNVGIGTTQPSVELQVGNFGGTETPEIIVAGGTTSQIQLNTTNATGSFAQVGFGGTQFATSNTAGKIRYTHTSQASPAGDIMSFRVNYSDRMVINGSGDVGIGTTNPENRLEVEDSGTLGANKDVLSITNKLTSSPSVDTTVGMNFNLQQSNNNAITYGAIRVGEHSGTGSIKGSMRFMVQDYSGGFNLAERMRIESDGNVGIGTDNPSQKLEVSGNALIKNGSNAYFFLHDTTNFLYSDNIGNTIIRSANNFRIQTKTNGGESVRVNSAGDVGIGTNQPNAKLEVAGSTRITGTGLDVGYGNNGTNYVQVGYGRSTNGYALLDLIGDDTYDDYGFRILRNNNGPNADTDILHRGTGDLDLKTIDAGDIGLHTASIQRMIVKSSGNVGIGTIDPQAKLEIAGHSSSGKFLLIDNVASGETFLNVEDGFGSQLLQVKRETDNTISFNSYNDFSFIDNVGIGTTSPQSKLQVNGGVQLSNDTASPSASKVGTFRYRTSGNNSYVDMCMQTGASTYAWVNIVTNSW